MFSDRGRLLKFLIPLGLLVLLGADASWRVGESRPGIGRMLADPDRYDGRDVWLSAMKIVETAPDGIVGYGDGARLLIRTPERPAIGSFVMVGGVFRKDRSLEARQIHVSKNWEIQRGGIYGISALVLVIFGIAFLKRFRLGWKGIRPKEAERGESGVESTTEGNG